MAPNQNRKTTRACKELQPFGISADEVREALKELLNLYEHNWKFIEDDNYKVLHDFILDKKQEKEKSVKSIEKELCLRDESEDDEIPLAVQNVRNNKRKASTSVDNSNLRVVKSPLGKAQQESQTMSRPFSPARNLSKKHREPDCQILQDTQITNFCSSYKKARPKSVSAQGKGKTLVILQAVPKKRGSKSERGTEIVNAEGQAVENCSELVTMNVLDRFYGDDSLDIPRDELLNQPQDEVPLAVEYLVVPDQRIKMACKALKPFGFSGGEVKEVLKRLLELYDNNWVFIEDENYKILLDHLLQEKKDVHSVKRFCDGLEDAEELETPPKIQQYQTHKKRLASSSLTGSNEQVEKDYKVRKKTPATPHADSRVRELNCEVGIGDVFIGGSGVEDCRNLVVAESVPDKCHSDSLDMTYGNQPGQALDEVPLVVILPDPPSQLDEDGSSERNSSSKIKEFLEPISSEGKNKVAVILSNEDGSSNGNVSDGKADFGLVETRLPYVNDSFPKASQFDIASTSNGEVKISLICSPFQNDFQFPCLDTVVKMVEDKWLKSKRTMETSLIEKLMKELCDCFLILGSASADGQHVGSTSATLETSKQSDAQDIHCGKEDHNFSHSILPDLSWRSIRVQNLVEVLLPIPKGVVLNGLSDLRFVTGLNIKDLNISRYSEKMMKVLTVGRQSSYPVQVHCSSYDAVKSYNYIDDITRGEERVKISLVSDCTGEALPNFSYIPQNTVYRKAVVNFALACIPHEGCCSDCFKDCLSSASPCVCAQKPGGGFSYKSGGLVNEEFLEECICMNQDPKALHYFYCKKCPIGSSEERDSSDPCEGHLSRKFLKECWAKCGCSKSCGNRVVQRGITANLQVFLTSKDKGWGLRTLEDLPKGAFICEYVGEVVTKSELHERNIKKTGNDQKLTYSVVLDAAWNSHDVLKDDDVLYLDATVYGNVARFINHRCSDATLIAIPVEMESPNRRYYHLGFFTTRNIKAMEELTWDYGINFNDTQSAFKCVCGSRYCRGRIGKHSKV